MKCVFEGCEELRLWQSDSCWKHLSDKEGYKAHFLTAAIEKKDLTGCNLRRIVLNNVQLEKINLAKANLSLADLSGAHLFDISLEGSDLIGAELSGCDIVHCDLRGADLTRANLSNGRIWNSSLDGAVLTESNLARTDFWGSTLYNVKLWHSSLDGIRSISMKNFASGTRLFSQSKINESGPLSAEDGYRDLKRHFISTGMYKDASWASFREKTMERLVFKKNGDLNYFPSMLMNLLCGYGEKPYRIVLSAFSAILIFALIYALLNAVEPSLLMGYKLNAQDYIYFSTITFTTVGYGDFIPKAGFRLLAAAEAFMGVFLTGLFIFTLARKYSAR